MIELSHWQAPQYIVVFLLVFALLGSFITSGQPATKTVRVKDGTEVKSSAGVLYGCVTFFMLLAWGGFFE